MEMLFILIPLSLGLVAFILWSFVWSVKNDQFDDLERQGWSILFEDSKQPVKKEEQAVQSSGDKTDEH
ncbi:MAG: cbb3-type cytochrome oxidase assembly protein CcoS [Pseudohongiella sp.]|nr:cbb3-type cytochrome oxidase assembly protein CcoS [Pseudohongiella sp.]MDO9522048.1 cbb3-type cytochrome oxidase assembly protein CcoS [Pseudohongiella sp.]MDP2128683.1 cbb3-type cytochrome oxidase assembly protein CcoS [Pseudohongiella sp.]